ncbi:MAG TPA: thioredoxin fold domain-containing protein [Trichormus sp.]|jgi:thiol:disulfide interchange protein
MAPVAETSTTYMPRALLVAAIVLLVARAAVWAATTQQESPTSSIHWVPVQEFKQGDAAAKGKLILYKFSAAWSDPCQRLESEILINHKVCDLAKNKFVSVVVEDRLREDGKNSEQIVDLQKRYHVFAFPTLVIVDSNGDSKGLLVGCSSSLSTYRFLARAAQTQTANAVSK